MTTVKSPVKGNKTTEIIVGAAAAKLTTVVKGIKDAVIEVEKLEQKAQDGTLRVSDLEDKIGGLEQDLKNKIGQNKIELQQAYDANKESFARQWLQSMNMACIQSEELEALKNNLENATMKVEETVSNAVKAATGAMANTQKNELALAKLQHEKDQASTVAELAQAKSQITFLEAQVKMWKDALDAQRAAETERSKHGAINTLNVGSPSNGR